MTDMWFLNEWLSITEGIAASGSLDWTEILANHALHPPTLWGILPSLGIPPEVSAALGRLYELIEHPHPSHTPHNLEEARNDFLRISRSFRGDLTRDLTPTADHLEDKSMVMRVLWLGVSEMCLPLARPLRRRVWSALRRLQGSAFLPARAERLRFQPATNDRLTVTMVLCSNEGLPCGHGINTAIFDGDAIGPGYSEDAVKGFAPLVSRIEFEPDRTPCGSIEMLWVSGPRDLDPLEWLVSAKQIAPWDFNARREFEFEDTQLRFGRWLPKGTTEANRDHLFYLMEDAYDVLVELHRVQIRSEPAH